MDFHSSLSSSFLWSPISSPSVSGQSHPWVGVTRGPGSRTPHPGRQLQGRERIGRRVRTWQLRSGCSTYPTQEDEKAKRAQCADRLGWGQPEKEPKKGSGHRLLRTEPPDSDSESSSEEEEEFGVAGNRSRFVKSKEVLRLMGKGISLRYQGGKGKERERGGVSRRKSV